MITNQYGGGSAGFATHNQRSQDVARVRVELHTFQKLLNPYEVQCFFVARDEKGTRSVYDVIKIPSESQTDIIIFTPRELFAGSKSEKSRVRDFNLSDGSTFRLTEASKTTVAGKTAEGWIVRVISADRIVRVEASLSELRELAFNQPEELNAIAAESVKPRSAQKSKKRLSPTPQPTMH